MATVKRKFGFFEKIRAANNLTQAMENGWSVDTNDLQKLGLDESLAKRFKR